MEIKEPKNAIWLKKWLGAFKDSPYYDSAMKLGEEYRRSQTNPSDDFDAIIFDHECDARK